MFKYAVAIFAIIACAAAKPGVIAPLAYSAPLVAAPGIVTATSSQVIARNYNGIATAPIVADAPITKYVAGPVTAPVVAAPLAAKYVASPLAYSAPLAYSTSLATKYVASPFAGPLAYSAPLTASPLGYAASYGYASPLSYASAPLLF